MVYQVDDLKRKQLEYGMEIGLVNHGRKVRSSIEGMTKEII